MLKPDFSDIQKNGFRVNQLRLFHCLKNECVGDNLIQERDYAICYLIEENEIHFTISYLSLRLMFLFIFAAILSLLSRGTGFFLTLILSLLSIILFLIARKYREYFILGNISIEVSEDIYNSKIKEKYNF